MVELMDEVETKVKNKWIKTVINSTYTMIDRRIATAWKLSLQGGFLPNVFKVLSHRPAEFRAFFSYYNELMNKETGLYCLSAGCVCV